MFIIDVTTIAPQHGWHKITIDEMAATMQRMEASGVRTTPENLYRNGYSMDEIGLYGLRAARLARLRSLMAVIK